MAEELIPIVQRSYDLCVVLYEHVNRFPRAQRTLLGRVILDEALRMLVSKRMPYMTLREAQTEMDAHLLGKG